MDFTFLNDYETKTKPISTKKQNKEEYATDCMVIIQISNVDSLVLSRISLWKSLD
jgi:hypothetical protein